MLCMALNTAVGEVHELVVQVAGCQAVGLRAEAGKALLHNPMTKGRISTNSYY